MFDENGSSNTRRAARWRAETFRVRVFLPLFLFASSACGDDLSAPIGPPSRAVRVMSYNIASAADAVSGAGVAMEIASKAPDFVAVQECVGCNEWLVDKLGGGDASTAPAADVDIIYTDYTWHILHQGSLLLGTNDDGWGERMADWALFVNADGSQGIYIYSTHWCVTIRRPDDDCDVPKQLEYANTLTDQIAQRAEPEVPVVLMGDFNVFDGFESGPVVQFLEGAGFVDVFRDADPTGDGTTFLGNDWAPAGRIDYIFATPPSNVLDSYIDRRAEGSDHYPVVATVDFAAWK